MLPDASMPMPDAQDKIGQIRRALQGRHAVTMLPKLPRPAEPGEPDPGPETPFSVQRPSLLVAEHFETTCDLLVHDPRSGTLGLVHWLVDGPDAKEPAPDDGWRAHLEHAAHIRHLAANLSVRPGHGATGRPSMPLSVEVVLAYPAERTGLTSDLGKLLRRIIADQEYLHGIGVNLLPWREGDPRQVANTAALDKAFCWLLTATRRWFNSIATPAASRSGHPLEEIIVKNWRLSGTRELKFDAEQTVQLVHGRNGSGKSSLAEAIEYAVTGGVERLRLAGKEDIHEVVDHRPSNRQATRLPAEVELRPPVDRSAALPVGAFLLDQRRMDRLAADSDEERAAHFLATFFPDHAKAEKAYKTSLAALEKALNGLDWAFPRQGLTDEEAPNRWKRVKARLNWASKTKVSLPLIIEDWWSLLASSEGKEKTSIAEELEPLLPSIRARLADLPHDPVPQKAAGYLERMSELHREILKACQDTEAVMTDGLRALDTPGLALWTPEAPTETATIQTLKDWLDAMAMTDLVHKQGAVVRSIRAAERAGWTLPTEPSTGLDRIQPLARTLAEDLDKAAREWAARLDELRQQMAGYNRERGSAARRLAMRPVLGHKQISDLDAAGRILFGSEDGAAPLGQSLAEAIHRGASVRIGVDLLIGDVGWFDRLKQRMQALLDRVVRIRRLVDRRDLPGPADFRAQVQSCAEAARIFEESGRALRTSLLDRILPMKDRGTKEEEDLSASLQEMIGLLTPARWAYGPVTLFRGGPEGRDLCVGYQDGGPGGHLRLNTAELNVFTVALFVLCAPLAKNPARLLVFDDPLQNMDEMTVTAFARGVSRLSPLLAGSGWRLLFLFHGEDDVARFESECACAVIRLPWLTPQNAHPGAENLVLAGKSRYAGSRQAIGTVLSLLPEGAVSSDRAA